MTYFFFGWVLLDELCTLPPSLSSHCMIQRTIHCMMYNGMQRTGKEAGLPFQICECHSLGLGIPSCWAVTRYFYCTITLLCYLL